MITPADCLLCFVRQGMTAAELAAPDDPALKELAIRRWLGLLAELDYDQPPPVLAQRLYHMLEDHTGRSDLFAEHKRQANDRVLEMLPLLRDRVEADRNPLRAAMALSIVGNYIDNGAAHQFDWESALLEESLGALAGPAMAELEGLIVPHASVVILGDNAGEIGIDTILVRVMTDLGARVCYAVREAPILNDATLEDARTVGMDRLCSVVSTGCRTPGTLPDLCFPEFRERLRAADVIISKGQGNFESMHGRWSGVFFALKIKCPMVSRMLGRPEGDSILIRQ